MDKHKLNEIGILMERESKMDSNIELLRTALGTWRDKWEECRDRIPQTEETVREHVRLTSMIYMAQWIVNSINGGLDKPHGTNICNILREKNE